MKFCFLLASLAVGEVLKRRSLSAPHRPLMSAWTKPVTPLFPSPWAAPPWAFSRRTLAGSVLLTLGSRSHGWGLANTVPSQGSELPVCSSTGQSGVMGLGRSLGGWRRVREPVRAQGGSLGPGEAGAGTPLWSWVLPSCILTK